MFELESPVLIALVLKRWFTRSDAISHQKKQITLQIHGLYFQVLIEHQLLFGILLLFSWKLQKKTTVINMFFFFGCIRRKLQVVWQDWAALFHEIRKVKKK